MHVSFLSFDEAGLRECLSQDRRGRARTLPTHLPGPDVATPTALALHPTCGRPRKVETLGGGEGCRGVVQDAGVQAPGVRITCCFRKVSPRLQLVRTWSFVGLRVDTILKLTDGRAECLRVTGNTKRRSFAPSATGSHGTLARAGIRAACAGATGATGGGRRCKTLGEWCNFTRPHRQAVSPRVPGWHAARGDPVGGWTRLYGE